MATNEDAVKGRWWELNGSREKGRHPFERLPEPICPLLLESFSVLIGSFCLFFPPSWAKIPKGIFPSIKWRKGQGTNLWIRCFSNKWFKCLCRLQQLCNAPCLTGLPRWFNCKEYSRWCRRHRRHGFNPWVGKIPWRREWQPPPVFLPEKYHGQRRPGRLQSMGSDLDTNELAHTHVFDWLFPKCLFKDFTGGNSFTVSLRGRYRDLPHPLYADTSTASLVSTSPNRKVSFFFSFHVFPGWSPSSCFLPTNPAYYSLPTSLRLFFLWFSYTLFCLSGAIISSISWGYLWGWLPSRQHSFYSDPTLEGNFN